jgi:hypothetical protein
MSTGIFGNIRPADVSVNDIEVFYTYAQNRESVSTTINRFANPNDIISEVTLPTGDELDYGENIMEGFYNLTLPASVFSELGFYTIYFRPKVIKTTIVDCGVLSSLPTVKGIVLDGTQLDADLTANNALQGYKIEYVNSDNTKLRNTVRYVVTSNRVIPVTENIGNTSQTAVRYRFDDSGTLLFLQLTPASASNVKPNVTPFIGNPNQTILMSNTYFNPVMMEIELVENDIDSVVDYVAGEQIKDVDNGILTYYDPDREILRQFDLYEIKDDVTNTSLYEVKQRREVIDESQDFDDVTNLE